MKKEKINYNKKSTPNFQKRNAMELLCKELGIPFSDKQPPNGTASIRFMTRLKKEEKKEE